jgi:Leucine Rich Repeat (LRR) protein
MPRPITPRTTLDNVRKEAKRWLKALRDGIAEARARYRRALRDAPETPTLRDVQHALAREYGLPGWAALKAALAQDAPMRRYERVADALMTAYRTGERGAMEVVWGYFGHMRAWDAMRRYVRLDLGKTEVPQDPEKDELTLAEARDLVARAQGFVDWAALAAFVFSAPPGKATIAVKTVGAYTVTESGSKEAAFLTRNWDELLAVMAERRLPGLHASGQMTDELLERFSRLDHITSLDFDGSRGVTDAGLRHLARLPRLRHLKLTGCNITDRGLGVLRHLPALESIVASWTPVTDAGAAHLAACEQLREVDLTGTPSGDGAIAALAGKRRLCDFRSGNEVTNAGIARLHELPVFKAWQGGEEELALTRPDARPNFLMLRGRFTDEGLARLVGLDGLYALDLASNRLAVTGAGLAPLIDLAHLAMLGFEATDDAMPYLAALPHLRFLMCQDTVAGDDGFTALSRSRSLEYLWGRRCYNLRRRGFTALADMPALQYLSVSCRNVDDAGLSALPRFPALKELMPMDVPDDGYRHVGRCPRLESLVLMYCRDSGDVATQHITGLAGLKRYFASYNRISDRTPELLSGMPSLEEITFDSCAGLTDAGIMALARLPRLRALRVSGMRKVTEGITASFSPSVRVSYSP